MLGANPGDRPPRHFASGEFIEGFKMIGQELPEPRRPGMRSSCGEGSQPLLQLRIRHVPPPPHSLGNLIQRYITFCNVASVERLLSQQHLCTQFLGCIVSHRFSTLRCYARAILFSFTVQFEGEPFMSVRTARAAAADYYLSDRLAAERSYDGPRWAQWDCAGGLEWLRPGTRVKPADFRAAMAGRPPGEAPLTTRRRRLAYDLTIDCEKPLSARWALGPDKERAAIETVHDRAVTAIIAEVQRIGMAARRGPGGLTLEAVEMPATARFLHLTARPAPMPSGRMLPAPHLHSQVLVMNLARRQDGSWGAIDGGRLYRAVSHLTQVWRKVMDDGLRDCGIAAYRDEEGRLHMDDIDPRIVLAFSARRTALLRATQHIIHEPAAVIARQRIAVWDRAPKSALSLAELETAWRQEAAIAMANDMAHDTAPPISLREEDPSPRLTADDLCTQDIAGPVFEAESTKNDGDFVAGGLEDGPNSPAFRFSGDGVPGGDGTHDTDAGPIRGPLR
ncbi:MobF family relaxase [Aurantimonas sp. A2-1-M11]|uniref:MobF family relaxase n=1 Tax=Aurantimonas sp. A2-1-M11 TaxID=3113712 RepID=UPI002F94BB23